MVQWREIVRVPYQIIKRNIYKSKPKGIVCSSKNVRDYKRPQKLFVGGGGGGVGSISKKLYNFGALLFITNKKCFRPDSRQEK